jgi:aldehyde dehydrogenase (NAD+)
MFGPVLSVITVETFGQALDVLNNRRYGLSASTFTNDLSKTFKSAREAKVGVALVNMHTTIMDLICLLGIKMSGFGLKEQGRKALEFFTEVKSVYIRP